MTENASSILNPWSSFYVMTGSSAAALTGLMFIVITLVTGTERLRKGGDGISAFSTPTVVHFGAALLISAILSAPWRALIHPASLLGITGFGGVAYVIRVMFRTKNLTVYNPDLEDWAGIASSRSVPMARSSPARSCCATFRSMRCSRSPQAWCY